jgi:hypothetical protein
MTLRRPAAWTLGGITLAGALLIPMLASRRIDHRGSNNGPSAVLSATPTDPTTAPLRVEGSDVSRAPPEPAVVSESAAPSAPVLRPPAPKPTKTRAGPSAEPHPPPTRAVDPPNSPARTAAPGPDAATPGEEGLHLDPGTLFDDRR